MEFTEIKERKSTAAVLSGRRFTTLVSLYIEEVGEHYLWEKVMQKKQKKKNSHKG
jgi:hypothetical protein